MGAPRTGVCSPWATTNDLCGPCDDYAVNAIKMGDALQVASDVLFERSGRQWAGECSAVVRPCARSVDSDRWAHHGMGLAVEAGWGWNRSWGFCACNRPATRQCSCSGLSEITLGALPVTGINEIKIDGDILAPASYRIDDHRWLVRLDGESWPCCQDMSLDVTEDDTWQVDFDYGLAPPAAGVRAAATLACELYKACDPELVGQCQLPARVQQVARQGITVSMMNSLLFQQGVIGLWDVDLFLTTYNPAKLQRPSTVLSPDLGRRVRRAGT